MSAKREGTKTTKRHIIILLIDLLIGCAIVGSIQNFGRSQECEREREP